MFITDPAEYKSPSNGLAVSFSSLKLFERDEERFYRKHVLREVVPEEEDSHALKYGTAAHCLILEGREVFDKRFAVRPATYDSEGKAKPWNGNAKVCQAWAAKRIAEGRQVLTPNDMAELDGMVAAIAANPDATRLLDGPAGAAEIAIRRESGGLGFNRQGRVDFVSPYDAAVVDVKTIEDANDRKRVMLDRGYYRQLAYYLDLVEEEWPANPAGKTWRACIIWLEKEWPKRCLVEWLPEALINIGRQRNYATLGDIAERVATGGWKVAPASVEIPVPAELVEKEPAEGAFL